jgi:signal transduction histidine kinase
LDASRLRLLTAADRQRVQLADQLDTDTGETLSTLRTILAGIVVDGDEAVDEAWNRSIVRLEGLENDLRSLAAGLGPMLLVDGGLRRALQQLADDASSEVEIVLDEEIGERLDQIAPAVARTIYFVCAEGIANALKHAHPRSIAITIGSRASVCTVEVTDDGSGGADRARGSGLQGIMDRVAAIGGTLTLRSPVGCGTRLTAELPLESSAVKEDPALQVADPSPRRPERH